jgi:hypothetical protein
MLDALGMQLAIVPKTTPDGRGSLSVLQALGAASKAFMRASRSLGVSTSDSIGTACPSSSFP